MTNEQKENVKQWVAALRSNKYQQGQYQLQKSNKFCCLGVACDLYNPTRWGSLGEDGTVPHLGWALGPAEVVRDHFGLSIDDAGKLANMNDSGETFAEIADYIEENLL